MNQSQATELPKPICVGCDKTPDQLPEYVSIAEEEGMSPDEFVRTEEGTYNKENGHFLCTPCYVDAGMPASRHGWVAP